VNNSTPQEVGSVNDNVNRAILVTSARTNFSPRPLSHNYKRSPQEYLQGVICFIPISKFLVSYVEGGAPRDGKNIRRAVLLRGFRIEQLRCRRRTWAVEAADRQRTREPGFFVQYVALPTITGARADRYNYDLCGVVLEKWDPTSMLFQTILNA